MISRRNLVVVAVVLVLVAMGYYTVIRQTKNEKSMDDTKNVSQATITPTPATADLKIEDLKVGTGAEVKSGDTVRMHYNGTLEDGTKFDSSYDRGAPFQTKIGVGVVIAGWDKGVPGMKVGGKRKLIIPPALGYGATGIGSIPGNATLIFEVELVEIVN